jgi:hypothetical protein
VPIDPRALRLSELCRLLNSTPLGEVIAERQLHRHRTRAGYRIVAAGDDRRVDLFRYAAWLAGNRHARPPESKSDELTGYDATYQRPLACRGESPNASPRNGDSRVARHAEVWNQSFVALLWAPSVIASSLFGHVTVDAEGILSLSLVILRLDKQRCESI